MSGKPKYTVSANGRLMMLNETGRYSFVANANLAAAKADAKALGIKLKGKGKEKERSPAKTPAKSPASRKSPSVKKTPPSNRASAGSSASSLLSPNFLVTPSGLVIDVEKPSDKADISDAEEGVDYIWVVPKSGKGRLKKWAKGRKQLFETGSGPRGISRNMNGNPYDKNYQGWKIAANGATYNMSLASIKEFFANDCDMKIEPRAAKLLSIRRKVDIDNGADYNANINDRMILQFCSLVCDEIRSDSSNKQVFTYSDAVLVKSLYLQYKADSAHDGDLELNALRAIRAHKNANSQGYRRRQRAEYAEMLID